MRKFCIIIILIIAVVSCKKLTEATDLITRPSAREVYARNFEGDTVIFPKWERAFKKGLRDSLQIALPYLEKGLFRPANMTVHSYTVILKEGENFMLSVETDSIDEKVFLDVFDWTPAEPNQSKKIIENRPGEKSISFYVKKSGVYKILVQPEISLYSNFKILAKRNPSYAFPVLGKGNRSIQSFWGAPKGGGTRSHKGIDIFAKRGTPIIAVVKGSVSSVGERGLGGKQVWLSDGLFGNSLYYAHLDSIAVRSGQRVQIGDTLGFVGNTGNAKTTSPHLHFGIYKRFGGAVDPLPFVKKQEPISDFDLVASIPLENGIISSGKANLRVSNSSKAKKVGELVRRDSVTVMGLTKDWTHVLTKEGQKAFLYRSLISPY
ncbi:M23 family metallopeptidase [Flagellimonas maritima]|nr:M23 family metallopeptidase [Allomuricauda aurantiaca]